MKISRERERERERERWRERKREIAKMKTWIRETENKMKIWRKSINEDIERETEREQK